MGTCTFFLVLGRGVGVSDVPAGHVEGVPALSLLFFTFEVGTNVVDIAVSEKAIEFLIVFPS
jgi:hypothetical protein